MERLNVFPKHEKIFAYTGIWMDYIKDGKTQLVNTNKLLKKYLLRINLVICVFKNNQLFKMRNWREKRMVV